jgi:hypothetical protein
VQASLEECGWREPEPHMVKGFYTVAAVERDRCVGVMNEGKAEMVEADMGSTIRTRQ